MFRSKIIVRKHERALLFRDGDFVKFLEPGVYRFGYFLHEYVVERFDISTPLFGHRLQDFLIKEHRDEVERFFDTSGNLVCENHWLVEGQMTQWNSGATSAEYYLEFAIQGGPTACGDGEDEEWRYLVDYDFFAGNLDLSWAFANGGGWSSWAAETPFAINGAETEVEFEYVTDVMEAR